MYRAVHMYNVQTWSLVQCTNLAERREELMQILLSDFVGNTAAVDLVDVLEIGAEAQGLSQLSGNGALGLQAASVQSVGSGILSRVQLFVGGEGDEAEAARTTAVIVLHHNAVCHRAWWIVFRWR